MNRAPFDPLSALMANAKSETGIAANRANRANWTPPISVISTISNKSGIENAKTDARQLAQLARLATNPEPEKRTSTSTSASDAWRRRLTLAAERAGLDVAHVLAVDASWRLTAADMAEALQWPRTTVEHHARLLASLQPDP